jgi:lipase chaperone LimK
MAFLLDSKPGFAMACLLGAAAGVMGVVYLRHADAPAPAAAPARASSWDGPAGPGALAAAASSAGAAPADSVPGEQPLLDPAGHLMVDPALHRLYDSFLKNGTAGAPREQELRAWLKRRLAPPALAQAETLAGDYARYLKAEAALRANQRLAPPDPAGMSVAQVEQMLAWQQQRAQLRERMLGSAVSQAWFGTEDADCRSALADWRLSRTPAGSEEVDSNELRARRLHGAVLEQRRNERAQSCASQLMDRLAADGPAA